MWRRGFALLLVPALAGGCQWFKTMSDPPSIQAHEEQPFAPPEHAVPVGGLPEYNLVTAEGLLENPAVADAASVASGEATYGVFCTVCHGAGGEGGGPVADKFPGVPSLTTGRLGAFSDAYLFALISQGRGLMPGYGRIQRASRWDLVNYLRTLPGAAPTPALEGDGS